MTVVVDFLSISVGGVGALIGAQISTLARYLNFRFAHVPSAVHPYIITANLAQICVVVPNSCQPYFEVWQEMDFDHFVTLLVPITTY